MPRPEREGRDWTELCWKGRPQAGEHIGKGHSKQMLEQNPGGRKWQEMFRHRREAWEREWLYPQTMLESFGWGSKEPARPPDLMENAVGSRSELVSSGVTFPEPCFGNVSQATEWSVDHILRSISLES